MLSRAPLNYLTAGSGRRENVEAAQPLPYIERTRRKKRTNLPVEISKLPVLGPRIYLRLRSQRIVFFLCSLMELAFPSLFSPS